MEVIVKTKAYATNKNVNAIIEGLRAKGFSADVRTWPENGVAIVTNAPETALESIKFTRGSVRIIS